MKKKANRKVPYKDIPLSYVARPILNAEAMEFTFAGKLTIVAIHVPTVGVLVVGKNTPNNPSRCWSYPPKTSFKEAVSTTFRQILEDSYNKSKEKHDAC